MEYGGTDDDEESLLKITMRRQRSYQAFAFVLMLSVLFVSDMTF